MELTYKTKKLENLCENADYNRELQRLYGSEVAKKLPQRINELKAFDSVNDIPVTLPFRRHKLEGKRKDEFAVNINKEFRIIFRPYDSNIEIVDLRVIKNIEIMEVSKHYE